MRWQGRRESDNVEDRRGQSGSPFGGGGGGGFRLPSGKGGIVLLIIVLVAGYYGVDLTGMLTGEPMPQQQTSTQRSISPKDDEAAKFTSVILATTEDTWEPIFEKDGPPVPAAKAGALPRRDPYRLRHRSVGDGPLLLSCRQYGLYRPVILR